MLLLKNDLKQKSEEMFPDQLLKGWLKTLFIMVY